MIKAGKVIQLPFNYEETVNHYRLRIKTNTKFNSRIYIRQKFGNQAWKSGFKECIRACAPRGTPFGGQGIERINGTKIDLYRWGSF
jgi:hypothetical protein